MHDVSYESLKDVEFFKGSNLIHKGKHNVVYALRHPQWGGYVGKCLVDIPKTTGDADGGTGCFDVENFHDGEFAHDTDHPGILYHYCSAEQIVEFGVTILELIAKHQLTLGSDIPGSEHQRGQPVIQEKDTLRKLAQRLLTLADA